MVNMIDLTVLSAQPSRHTQLIAPEGDQIAVHAENTLFVLNSGPIDGDFILEPAIFEQLLALEKHRDAGRSQNKCSAQGGAFLGKPGVHSSRPDLLRHAGSTIGNLVVRLGKYDPTKDISIVLKSDSLRDCICITQSIIKSDDGLPNRLLPPSTYHRNRIRSLGRGQANPLPLLQSPLTDNQIPR